MIYSGENAGRGAGRTVFTANDEELTVVSCRSHIWCSQMHGSPNVTMKAMTENRLLKTT